MYRNYFYLNRSVIELNGVLEGHKIRNIYSQEKDKIVIECTSGLEERFFIEVCVNPGHPYLTVKEDFRRARKNVTDLFPEAEGASLSDCEIAVNDRIIKIITSAGKFYFMIRGKFTNFVFLNGQDLHLFKHHFEGSSEALITELRSREYTSAYNFPSMTSDDSDAIRKEYPFISKEVIAECKSRISAPGDFNAVLKHVIMDFINSRPAIFYDKNNNDLHIAPETFHLFNFTEKTVFDSYFPALNNYLSKMFQLQWIVEREKAVERLLEKELNKITSRIDKLKSRIENGSREDVYRRTAELLMINRYSLHKGNNDIEVQDVYAGGGSIKIRLDPAQSAQQNIDAYYEKARNEKINYEKSLLLHNSAERQLQRFLSIKKRFEEHNTKEELEAIMKELKIRDEVHSPGKEDISSKFKQYIIDKVYFVYVGKDSKNNDLLTTKFAKQNDYWFHARSVSGSHVVLRNDKAKENIPKNILKKAASLAAYHSKAKTAGTVPVSYTFKKYVVKKKGMEPGKVALLKEEVLLVSPEIPEGAEFVTE